MVVTLFYLPAYICRVKILDFDEEPHNIVIEQHEVDFVVVIAHVSLHRRLLTTRHAALWRPVGY